MPASIKTYEFSEFTLNPAKRTLFRRSEEIKLRDKDFDVLHFLIENAPATCSHDEIINAVWGEISVANNSLEKAITNIRGVLGDDSKNPRFIKTVRARGYLFIGDVSETEENHSNPNTENAANSSKFQKKSLNLKTVFASSAIILLFAFFGLIWWKGSAVWAWYNSKILFADDFSDSEVNQNRWLAHGSSVMVSGGILRLMVDETDNGGKVVSANISFDPNKPIVIQSRQKVTFNQMEKEKIYFYGSFLITPNVYDAKDDISFGNQLDEYGRGVSYTNSDDTDVFRGIEAIATEGFFLVKPFGRPHEKRSYYNNKVGARMEAIWAKWFEQKIIYHPANGLMEYFIDGVKKSEYNVGTMPPMENPQMRLYISPTGWWTNHSIEIDYIEITQ
jgi:DNA-binding winged helix-turn-helix (wHTH) protein